MTEIHKYADVKERIFSGLRKLAEPVTSTLTPKGKNVVYQDRSGNFIVTKDGYNIAHHIDLEDPVEHAVTEFIKAAAFRTNAVAGDGTTTSILLSDKLFRDGYALIERGMNPADLVREIKHVETCLVDEITSRARKVDNDEQLEYVASVSSSNDEEIAKNVARVVSRAGQDGLVFLEGHSKPEVEIIEENGFVMNRGLYHQHLANRPGNMAAIHENALVFITDKRLYYEDEVIEILKSAAALGENRVIVVAADFIGQAPAIFISNHMDPKVNMEILLIKEDEEAVLGDLATYLKGKVVLDKDGSLADRLASAREGGKKKLEEFFTRASKVLADPVRTMLLTDEKKNLGLELHLKALKEQLKKVDEDSSEGKKYKRRIACLTNGITTVRVGASTQPELQEKLHRYQDAISATRVALAEGYVVGGGLTLWAAYNKLIKGKLKNLSVEVRGLIEGYCKAPLQKIAENCNVHEKELFSSVTDTTGYNANTERYEDLLEAGIIEPLVVLRCAVENSMSVAAGLLSGNHIITIKETTTDK